MQKLMFVIVLIVAACADKGDGDSADGGVLTDASGSDSATSTVDASLGCNRACVSGEVCNISTGYCSVALRMTADVWAKVHFYSDGEIIIAAPGTGGSTVNLGDLFYVVSNKVCDRKVYSDTDHNSSTLPELLLGVEFKAERPDGACWSGDPGCFNASVTHLYNCTSGSCNEMVTGYVFPCDSDGSNCRGGSEGNEYVSGAMLGLDCSSLPDQP